MNEEITAALETRDRLRAANGSLSPSEASALVRMEAGLTQFLAAAASAEADHDDGVVHVEYSRAGVTGDGAGGDLIGPSVPGHGAVVFRLGLNSMPRAVFEAAAKSPTIALRLKCGELQVGVPWRENPLSADDRQALARVRGEEDARELRRLIALESRGKIVQVAEDRARVLDRRDRDRAEVERQTHRHDPGAAR